MKQTFTLFVFAAALSLQAQTGYEPNAVISQLSSSLVSGVSLPDNQTFAETVGAQKSFEYYVQKTGAGDLDILQIDYKSGTSAVEEPKAYHRYLLERDGDISEEVFDLQGTQTGGTKTESQFSEGILTTKDVYIWADGAWTKNCYYQYNYDSKTAGTQVQGGEGMVKRILSIDLFDTDNNLVHQQKYNYTKIGATAEEIAEAKALDEAKAALATIITDAKAVAATITHQEIANTLLAAVEVASAVADADDVTKEQLDAAKETLLAAIADAKKAEADAIEADNNSGGGGAGSNPGGGESGGGDSGGGESGGGESGGGDSGGGESGGGDSGGGDSGNENPTALNTIQLNAAKTVIRNANGIVVTNLNPGKTYIANGKKIIIK